MVQRLDFWFYAWWCRWLKYVDCWGIAPSNPNILKGEMTPSLNVDRNSLTCGDPLLCWTWPVMTLWQNGMFRILVHHYVSASYLRLARSASVHFDHIYAHQCIYGKLPGYFPMADQKSLENFSVTLGNWTPSAPHSITKDNRLCRCSFIVGYITLLFFSHLTWG